jgi:hypothetical protein
VPSPFNAGLERYVPTLRFQPFGKNARRRLSRASVKWKHRGRLAVNRQEMIERDVNVTGRSGAIPSFAVCPDGPEPFPGIILYMDAPGIREELRNLARRIAKHGISACCPTCTTESESSGLTSCAEPRACGRPSSRR